ncbi:hypothetical protein QJS66_18730 [Kocuria rhizophila]|nr:hypothetical protein QJS66_18730 [Kocuria rhizophila]
MLRTLPAPTTGRPPGPGSRVARLAQLLARGTEPRRPPCSRGALVLAALLLGSGVAAPACRPRLGGVCRRTRARRRARVCSQGGGAETVPTEAMRGHHGAPPGRAAARRRRRPRCSRRYLPAPTATDPDIPVDRPGCARRCTPRPSWAFRSRRRSVSRPPARPRGGPRAGATALLGARPARGVEIWSAPAPHSPCTLSGSRSPRVAAGRPSRPRAPWPGPASPVRTLSRPPAPGPGARRAHGTDPSPPCSPPCGRIALAAGAGLSIAGRLWTRTLLHRRAEAGAMVVIAAVLAGLLAAGALLLWMSPARSASVYAGRADDAARPAVPPLRRARGRGPLVSRSARRRTRRAHGVPAGRPGCPSPGSGRAGGQLRGTTRHCPGWPPPCGSVSRETAWPHEKTLPQEYHDYRDALEFTATSAMVSASALRGQAELVRRAEYRRAERAAEALAVKLALPLGLCFLPAFMRWGAVPGAHEAAAQGVRLMTARHIHRVSRRGARPLSARVRGPLRAPTTPPFRILHCTTVPPTEGDPHVHAHSFPRLPPPSTPEARRRRPPRGRAARAVPATEPTFRLGY